MSATPRRIVDLFCGAGGLSEGFRQAGYDVVAGSDIDPDACATYRINFPESATICGDLRDPTIHATVVEMTSDVDVLAGGPPCQGFSQVRNHARLIDDSKNALYREFVELATEIAPAVLVMENVPGMAQMGVIHQVEEDLSCGGMYRVRAALVDAGDFGVPQTRKRLVFIGVRSDLSADPPTLRGTGATSAVALARDGDNLPAVRTSTPQGRMLLDQLVDPWDDSLVSVEQAIGDLVDLRKGTSQVDSKASTWLGDPTSSYQKSMRDGLNGVLQNVGVPRMNDDTEMRLRAIPPGGNHLDLPVELTDRYLTGSRWGQANGTGVLSRKHFYAYRRLHPAIWSWTLNTKADSTYHWSSERALAVREFARLQSFPDRFVFTTDQRRGDLPGRIDGGPGHSRYRQVGNAVPPLLAKAIATAVTDVLG